MFGKKFNTDDLYFTGCMHLQHKNITKGVSNWSNGGMRDFATTEEMTSAVIKSAQSVPEDAHLFILGDIIFGDKTNLYNLMEQIPCKNLYYIFGNHCYWMRQQKSFYSQIFKFIGDYIEIHWGRQMICLSHYPFAVWNESHRGSWMLHSHSHGTYTPGLPTENTHGKILDVGWDVWQRPVSVLEIQKVMQFKNKAFLDHHNERTT